MKKLDNSKCWGNSRSKNEKNKINKSLEVRDKINSILEEDNLRYDVSFNDLYKIKGGEVRRLKGFVRVIDREELRGESIYGDYVELDNGLYKRDLSKYNKLVNRVSKLINNLEVDEFKINISKRNEVSKWYFEKLKKDGNIDILMSWEDYKNECLNDETCCIIKIEWKY